MHDTKHLPVYRGTLTMAQIAEGMNAAYENSERLKDDAQFMLNAGRFPSAFALAVLAIEEFGKLMIFRRMSHVQDSQEMKARWKEFTQHKAKSVAFPALDAAKALMSRRPVKLEDLRPIFMPGSEHPAALDRAKQFSIYVDCIGSTPQWSKPVDAITEAEAREIVRIATENIGERSRGFTAREMELWRDAMGATPTFDSLVRWYAAMQAEGIFPAGPNSMEQFVHHGIGPATAPAAMGEADAP